MVEHISFWVAILRALDYFCVIWNRLKTKFMALPDTTTTYFFQKKKEKNSKTFGYYTFMCAINILEIAFFQRLTNARPFFSDFIFFVFKPKCNNNNIVTFL